jgi:lipoprotein NlpI
MKKNLLILAIAVLGFVELGQAQAQNPECLTNLSIYTEYVKVKNYDAAYEPWKQVYETCPSLNWANFLYGERILKDKIDKSEGSEKSTYITCCWTFLKILKSTFQRK